jgi:serine/threonine protein kinase
MAQPDSSTGVPLVGDVIAGKYRVDSVLGEGGMGIVYEAEHLILRQKVAIKALLPGATISPEVIERFSFEASTVARMASEHVVRIMDAGMLPNGSPYLVMEYLAGCDLETLLARRGPLPQSEVADVALQALEALAHAHAAGIVHRDLKPANLFSTRDKDGRQIIKLLDFGISKSLGMSLDEGHLIGSPMYMSPEQLERGAVIDHRTDLWALGVVIYQLIAGVTPFGGELHELIAAIRRAEPIPLHARDPRVAPELSAIVARCLRRSRSERWGSAAELAAALVPFGTGAWSDALRRTEKALELVQPVRSVPRYETFENALQALEVETTRHAEEAHAIVIAAGQAPGAPLVSTLSETLLPAQPDPDELAPVSIPTAPASALYPSEGEDALAVTCLPPSSALVPPSVRPALRILLIDDSAIALAVHSELLTGAGFDVRCASSLAEFNALLTDFRPQLVLMDVMMPGMNGDVLCRRVKERFKATVPVVLLSDLPRDDLAARAEQAGADGYLAKPGDRVAFLEYIRNICAITYSPEDLP